MPILDSILVSEKKAEELRLIAHEKVKSLLDETTSEANQKIKQMHDGAILEEENQVNETSNYLDKLEKEVISQTNTQILAQRNLAKERLSSAVNIIIKKVFEL